jgi:ubiquinone/menaquinone biosynthesis C-methylase UbiE
VGQFLQPLKRFLRMQFGHPEGLCGHLAGLMMARTPSNMERISWTLSLLDLKPNDRILEIGFGPGISIELLAKLITRGLIVGIDHSEVMVRQARRRNANAIRKGGVTLLVGSASDLPAFTGPFDKIFTINSIHFWNRPIDCLKKLHGLLKPGGVIAVTIQPRSRGVTDATAAAIGQEVLGNLGTAGFSQCRMEIRHTRPVATACAIGIR